MFGEEMRTVRPLIYRFLTKRQGAEIATVSASTSFKRPYYGTNMPPRHTESRRSGMAVLRPWCEYGGPCAKFAMVQ